MKEKLLKWLHAAGVRAIRTVAQTAVATIGTGDLVGSYWNIDVDVRTAGQCAVGKRQHGDAGKHGDQDDTEQGHFGVVNDDTLQNWFHHARHVQYRHGRYAHVYCAHQRWQ